MLIHANDPYWPSVSLLVKNTGVNGANNNTLVDSSPNNFTITRNGNVAQGSFGPATNVSSGYFDGSGDYLSISSNTLFNFSTGDFTLETYYNSAVSLTTGNTLNDRFFFSASGSGGLFFGISTGSAIEVGIGRTGIAWDNRVAITITPNTWNHIAVTRTSGTVRFWLNGVQLGTSFTNTTSYNLSTTSLNIGSQGSAYYWNGWLALARASNIARYTTNFTPSTSYTSDANTSLFLQFNNAAIYDATQKNNIETVGGVNLSTSVTFMGNPTIVLDGTTGYLKIPYTSNFTFGTGAFTIDGWFRLASIPGASSYPGLVARSFGTQSTTAWAMNVNPSGNGLGLNVSNGTTWLNPGPQSSTPTFNTSTWYYFQLVADGTTRKYYVNGTLTATSTSNPSTETNTGSSSTPIYIGSQGAGAYLNAYLADIRITKGIARPNIVPIMPFSSY